MSTNASPDGTKRQRHVILLGAGASVTSGYPQADRLRLLMSSERQLLSELSRVIPSCNEDLKKKVAEQLFQPYKDAIELFRHGGFATIDEFSNLAFFQFPTEIQSLKKLLRFVLAIHNPEDEFQKSDYYRLIQKLFRSDLVTLRDDVAILTFNYDCYLPYLLHKAATMRHTAAGRKPDVQLLDAITSGLSSRLIGSLEDDQRMCLLQLHGSIGWPRAKDYQRDTVWHGDLFEMEPVGRIERLLEPECLSSQPPVLFPWEAMVDGGELVPENNFCIKETQDRFGNYPGGYVGETPLHRVFQAIWKRGQAEISRATKISFVGLSMHDFLNPAFAFLFRNKTDNAAIVVTNKEHVEFRSPDDVEAHTNPRSPTFKVRRLLRKICPTIQGVPNRGKAQVWFDQGATVRVRETFDEFIRFELDQAS